MTLLYLIAAWSTGIFLASQQNTSITGWIILAVASALVTWTLRTNRRARLVWACAMMFMLGAARLAWSQRPLSDDHIAHYADVGYVTITGVVVQDPDIRDTLINLRVDAEQIAWRDSLHPTEGIVLVQASRLGKYTYGDRVQASGSLLTPPEFDDFSYRDYLARRGIHVIMPNADAEVISHHQGQTWLEALYTFKARAQSVVNRTLPSPQAPLLSGILLGAENDIPENIREAFNDTGTSHIIAISGANIIVVIAVFMRFFDPLVGRKRAALLTTLAVASYAILVGGNGAVVRAAITGSLALMAAQSGRKAHGLTSLAFAIWLMSLWNPFILWDISFQLSAAATTGLVLFGDYFTRALERGLRYLFEKDTARQVGQFLSEPVALGLAAQVTTMPLIVLYFNRFSAISLLANLLISPVQPYIMTMGWLGVLLGMIWPFLGEPMAWIAWLPLTYTLKVVRALSTWGWASFSVNVSAPATWVVYAGLMALGLLMIQHPDDRAALFLRIRRRISVFAIVATGAIVAILVWATAMSQPDGKLHIWFLDVGHGQAVLIRTPNGSHILIDGGPSSNRLRQTIGDAIPFWNHTIDLMLVTQTKSAAATALPSLLDRYDVKLALTTGTASTSDSYTTLMQTLERDHIPTQVVSAGYRIETSDHVTLEILNPQIQTDNEAKPEDISMVIQVRYGTASFLITSDLSTHAEQEIIDAGWFVGSTVLLLPGQGDEDTNPDFFLNAVRPQVAIAMVGAGNRANLPNAQTIERLQTVSDSRVYRTDRDGTIEIVTDGQTLWVYKGD